LVEALERDACVVLVRVLDTEALDRLRRELAPWIEATSVGPDSFTGRRTKRTGALIARSEACRDLVTHPSVLGAVEGVLTGATSFHLHLTQVISIGPGEPAQAIHRDQWAFDFFPFPKGYEAQCNTTWLSPTSRSGTGPRG